MGAGRPKQFLALGGRPVLLHSLETFTSLELGGAMCLVAPHLYIEETERILRARKSQDLSIQVVAGGADRHASTVAGLKAIFDREPADTDVVLIHDVARPLIQGDEVERLVQAFWEDPDLEVASLAAPITETIVQAQGLPGQMDRSVDRSQYFAIKTPQAASVAVLRRMLAPPHKDGGGTFSGSDSQPAYSDLLTWGEAHGIPGRLIPAGPRNLKLTHPDDLPWLESLLGSP